MKRNCEPKIGDAACIVLRDFYLQMRQNNLQSNGCNPITMRHLESLMRLTQARAKCEMRTECSRKDAEEVIEIMKASMVDCHENELSMLDFSQATQSQSRKSSKSSQIKQFIDILVQKAQKEGRKVFNITELKQLISVIFHLFLNFFDPCADDEFGH